MSRLHRFGAMVLRCARRRPSSLRPSRLPFPLLLSCLDLVRQRVIQPDKRGKERQTILERLYCIDRTILARTNSTKTGGEAEMDFSLLPHTTHTLQHSTPISLLLSSHLLSSSAPVSQRTSSRPHPCQTRRRRRCPHHQTPAPPLPAAATASPCAPSPPTLDHAAPAPPADLVKRLF